VTPYPHTIQNKAKLHLNEFYRIRTSSKKEIEAISDYIKYIDNKKENFKKQIKKYKKLI